MTQSSDTAAPRVAVWGAGYWGKNLVRNFAALQVLSSICDANPETLAAFREQYPGVGTTRDANEILTSPHIDAVVVATPAETHRDHVRRALEHGKDVFVEKPLCLNYADGEALVELAAARGRILMVGHVLWYHPAILKLKELVDQGELGRIQYVYSNRLNLGKIRREENILWSFAPHDISVILGILNELPESVVSEGGNYLHRQIADVTISCLSFPSGVKAHIFVSWLHPFKEQKLVIVGDRKMVVFDDLEPQDKLQIYAHEVAWQEQQPVIKRADAEVVPLSLTEPLREECRHFLECIRTRRQPRTNGAEGLRVLSVLGACQESLNTGRKVTVGPHGEPVQPTVAPRHAAGHYTAHESAFIDDGAEIGEGTQIWHVSHILRDTKVGSHCRIGQNVVIGPRANVGDRVKIQNNVSVYEGVTLEDDVFCGPSMVFTNVNNPRSFIPRMNELRPTVVRRGATLGANCTIVCGTTIGEYAFVGAGAVVTRDIPSYGLVVGNPAHQIGWVCRCGERLQLEQQRATCLCGDSYQELNGQLTPLSTAQISP